MIIPHVSWDTRYQHEEQVGWLGPGITLWRSVLGSWNDVCTSFRDIGRFVSVELSSGVLASFYVFGSTGECPNSRDIIMGAI